MALTDKRIFSWLAAVIGSTGLAFWLGASTSVAAHPNRADMQRKAREARARHAETTRRMEQARQEQRRVQHARRGADARPGQSSRRAPKHNRPPWPGRQHDRRSPDAPPSDPKLQYRFSRGQAFAYDVAMEWKPSGPKGRSGRLSGRPYFVVNHADKFDVVLMVIGRLRYEEIANDGTSRKIPEKDYWLGTSAILNRTEGKKSGRRGPSESGYVVLPGYQVGALVFPELPYDSNSEIGSGGTVEEFKGRMGPGAPPLVFKRGTQSFSTRSTPLRGSLVRLVVEKKYLPDYGSSPSVNRSTATFDHRLGAVMKHVAQQTRTKDGIAYTVNLHVRRISNSKALEEARQLAMHDFESLPEKMKPIELSRKRLDLFLPKRYDEDDLPAPGTVVGHLDSEHPVPRAWYAAEFVEQIKRDEVLIRYLGSGETATVRPAAMARVDSRRR